MVTKGLWEIAWTGKGCVTKFHSR